MGFVTRLLGKGEALMSSHAAVTAAMSSHRRRARGPRNCTVPRVLTARNGLRNVWGSSASSSSTMPRALSTTSPSPPATCHRHHCGGRLPGWGGARPPPPPPPPPILRLPTELLYEIVCHLPATDFLACRLSCSRFLHATEFRSLFAAVCRGGSGHRGGGNDVSSGDAGSDEQSLASLKQQLFRRLTELPPLGKCRFGFLFRSSTHLHSHRPPVRLTSPPAPAVLLAQGDATFIAAAFPTVVYVFVAFSLVPASQHGHQHSHSPSQVPCLASPPTMILAHRPPAALHSFYASQGSWQHGPRLYVLLLLHADDTAAVKVGVVGGACIRDTVLRHPCRIRETRALPPDSLRVRSAAIDAAKWLVFACAAGTVVYSISSCGADGSAPTAGCIVCWAWIPHPAADPAPSVTLPPHVTLSPSITRQPSATLPPPPPSTTLPPPPLPPWQFAALGPDPAPTPALAPAQSWLAASRAAQALHHPPHQSECTVAGYAVAWLSAGNLIGAVRYLDGEIRVFDTSAPGCAVSAFLASEPAVVQLGIALRSDPRCGPRPVIAVIAATADARLLVWHLTVAPLSRSAALLLSEDDLRTSSSTGGAASTPHSRLGGWRRAVAARLLLSPRRKDTAVKDGADGLGQEW